MTQSSLRLWILVGGLAITVSAVTTSGCGSATPSSHFILRVVNTSSGKMVVTGSGLTAYVYLPDQTHPSVATCTGDCANDWPPIVVSGRSSVVSGISKSLLGFVTRPDGTRQITLNGYPLYQYAADHRPGDIRGESVGDTWFAVDPKGSFLSLSPAGFSPAASHSPASLQVISTAGRSVIADGTGQTLYVYKDDTPTSTACTASWCVQDWPPLLVTQVPAHINGISASLGALRRPDGTLQLTVAAHPVYRFSGDQRPGDLRGLGIGGDWFPISPDGTQIERAG